MKVHTTNTVQYFKCLEVHSITNLKYPVSCITYTVLLQIIIIVRCLQYSNWVYIVLSLPPPVYMPLFQGHSKDTTV